MTSGSRIETDALIVGGGLAGLTLALRLHEAGRPFHLVEARNRFGGRIHTLKSPAGARYDLGPAWFWNGQPRMARLVQRFGLKVFEQYSSGELVFEDESGRVHRGRGFSSMQGSYRLEGGMTSLIDALVAALPGDAMALNMKIKTIRQTGNGILVEAISGAKNTVQISAEHIVLAIPPRLAEHAISFDPDLSAPIRDAMKNIPTWMAGQAKVMATYTRPFWREGGLSGDGRSHLGPIVEFHDASPNEGGPYALFGFVGTPPDVRNSRQEKFLEAVCQQLVRLFGSEAAEPVQLEFQDWAYEANTSTPLDLSPLSHHPQYGMPKALKNLWGGQLMFGSTEVADQFGGYLEGAIEATDHIAKTIGV